ncbi:glycosyltransferase [Macellibacteroides fermentans]|uniref:glycosyltransferase n=1 Tax=Macellibacteroides fermentans TaxID=879969 RepID=UPI00406C01E7
MISVIMSVYKEPIEWLKLSIDSIVAQDFDDWEFIIVCDNPDYKDAHELLSEYAEKNSKISIIFNEKNIGLTKSLNIALQKVSGDYIARMDADDISKNNRFSIQKEFLDTFSQYDLCYSDIDVINEEGKIIITNSGAALPLGQSNLFWECIIPHPTVMFRRRLTKLRLPLYNESYRTSQDYELWTFLTHQGVYFGRLRQSLLFYRHSTQQVTKTRKSDQLENFRKIRRSFISAYLSTSKKMLTENSSAAELYKILKGSKFNKRYDNSIYLIKYLLYYSQSIENKKYIFNYLIDSDFLWLRIKPFYTIAIIQLLYGKIKLPKFIY